MDHGEIRKEVYCKVNNLDYFVVSDVVPSSPWFCTSFFFKMAAVLFFLYSTISHLMLFDVTYTLSQELDNLLPPNPLPPGTQQDTTWDYLVFAEEWPQTFCLQANDTTMHPHCSVPESVGQWSIHGLWPTASDMSHEPENCNTSYPFNFTEIEDLKPQLLIYWPNLLNMSSTKFWSHEWNKHGTCALNYPPLHGEHNFFNKVLELRKNVSLDGVLSKANIVPDSKITYKADNFTNAIVAKFGKKPLVYCYTIVHGQKITYISQIEICFDKTFQPVHCTHQEGNCGDRDIIYPPIGGNTRWSKRRKG